MKKLFLLVIATGTLGSLKAQNVHDSVTCQDSSTLFSLEKNFSDAYWTANTGSNIFNMLSAPSYTEISPSLYSKLPAFIKTVYDDVTDKWYMFYSQASNGTSTDRICRINLGTDPTDMISIDSIFELPTFTTTNYNYLHGFDIVKDPMTKQWYGFAIRTNKLVRLKFGDNITNPSPAIDVITLNEPNIWFSHQLTLKFYKNNWHIFFASRAWNGRIYRVDFLNGLAGTPTDAIPIGSSFISEPMNFSLIEDNGNHYMFVTGVYTNLIRYDFGINLLNTSPVLNTLPTNPGVGRGLHLFKDCSSNQFYGYNLSEDGDLTKYSFGSNITNNPLAQIMSSSYGRPVSSNMITYNNKIYLQSGLCNYGDCSSIKIMQADFFTMPNSGSNAYNNNNASLSFSSTGVKNVKSYADQGRFSGPYSYCSNITVNECAPTSVAVNEVNRSDNYLYQNYPNPMSKFTTIQYHTDNKFSSKKIVIYNATGQEVLSKKITTSGVDKFSIDKELSSGMYYYSLIIDGVTVDTKKMVVL